MTFIEFTILIGVGLLASIWLMRHLDIAVALLVGSIALNIDLPLSLMGLQLNIQRLATLWIVIVYTFSVLLRVVRVPKMTHLQSRISIALLIIVVIDLIHALDGRGGVMAISLFMNILLYNLFVFLLGSINKTQQKRLFFILIPVSLSGVCIYYLSGYDFAAPVSSGSSEFYTGYRLRADDERNILNVWAGGITLMILLMVLPLISSSASTRIRVFGAISLMVVLVAMLSTFSRSAVVVLVLSGIVLGLLMIKYFYKQITLPKIILALSIIGIVIVVIIATSQELINALQYSWMLRLQTIEQVGDASLEWRIESVLKSMGFLLDAPLLGQGVYAREILGHDFENTYFYIAAMWGFFGLASFLSVLWFAARSVFTELKKKKNEYSLVAVVLVVAYALLGITNEYLAFPTGMIVLAFVTHNARLSKYYKLSQLSKNQRPI